MRQLLAATASLALTSFVSVTAWAADSPIGALTAQGTVTIEAPASSFRLTDQEYAYFSSDRIQTGDDANAVLRLNDGLTVTLVGDTEASISRENGHYEIAIDRGHMLVDAEPGIEYGISHQGEPFSPDQKLTARDKPFIVAVANPGDVQFYMPAQLDEGADEEELAAWLTSNTGLTLGEIAAIIAAITGSVYVVTQDDAGPSS